MSSLDRKPTLIEEMVESMALSMLIFLYADVRMMSQTGRIALPFENIAVDSDYSPRYTAAQLAGLEQQQNEGDVSKVARPQSEIPPECKNEGLSTAQIMACLLLELHKHVEGKRKAKEQSEADQALSSARRSTEDFEVTHDEFTSFNADPGKKPPMNEGDDMHSLLKAYAKMVGRDLNALVPHIEARRSVLNLTRPPENTKPSISLSSVPEESREKEEASKPAEIESKASGLSSVPEDNEVEESDEHHDDFFVGLEFGERAARRLSQIRLSQIQEINPVTQSRLQRVNERRKELAMTEEELTNKQFAELDNALFNMGESNRDLCKSIMQCSGRDERVSLDQDQLAAIMERAVESRIYGKLDFMADLFRKGTVSQLLAKNKVKVVWMNDWFPVKDLTYAIAVDPAKKRLIVVFRGAITKQDWAKAFDFNLKQVKNPIKEEFPGKPERVGIYSGFYLYLFRVRKDTGTTKYDEIATLAHKYGMEKIGADYSLVVCGHSLGAALSTVFSFHASAEERFTKNGPIKVFSFGSPYVGGHDFADCFRRQEEAKKVQYARFYNHNDFVAHVPDNFRPTKRGSKFRHVGIGIRIKPAPRLFRSCRGWKPSVFYVGDEGCCASYLRGIGRNFLFNTPWPWQIKQMHTLAELQKRVMDGSDMLKDDDSAFEMLQKPLDELYELLAGVNYKTSYA